MGEDAGSIIGGLLLIVFAGCLNGSWNAAFSPKVGLAVGKTSTTVEPLGVGRRNTRFSLAKHFSSSFLRRASSSPTVDLDYHLAWVLFMTYAALVNIPICLYWAGGPERTSWIVAQSSTTEISLIVVFSLLWGIGSVGFGLACRVAGVGLGTNLTMGTIMILGTLLPLLLEDLAATAAGGMILGGLVICSLGLYFSMRSLQTRDLDEQRTKDAEAKQASTGSPRQDGENEIDNKSTNAGEGDTEAIRQDESAIETSTEASLPRLSSTSDPTEQYSTLQKVLICVISGAFASQLQFAFVFGSDMIDRAESSDGPGSTPASGAAAVVWLFAIGVSSPVSIIYGSTSLPWVTHIHLYGFGGNSLLPDNLGAAVGWPILMMMTVTAGMIWSVLLGEWKRASLLASRQLSLGLGTVLLGILLIMASTGVSS